MPDQETQHDSIYHNYFMQLFDDFMSENETKLLPKDDVEYENNWELQKLNRILIVDSHKKSYQNMQSKNDDHLRFIPLIMVNECCQMDESERKKNAFQPMDIKIPNVTLEGHMCLWGIGGPIFEHQSVAFQMINHPRMSAVVLFNECVKPYHAFLQNLDFALENCVTEVSDQNFRFDRREEHFFLKVINAQTRNQMGPGHVDGVDGPSLGTAFLALNVLTENNATFKEFINIFMQKNPNDRVFMSTKVLNNRIRQLYTEFRASRELKKWYIIIAYVRKMMYTDDYLVALIAFIEDNESINWDQIENILYREVKPILQTCYEIAKAQEFKTHQVA